MGLKPGERPGEPLQPRLREVDLASGVVLRELAWESRVAVHTGEDRECMGSWLEREHTLWQCTRSEVLVVDLEQWEVVRHFSHPLFYDLHSIQPTPAGTLLLTSAGNELVLEMSRQGELLGRTWLRQGDFEAAYPGVTDFRLQPFARFKPHSHHPNHASVQGGRRWVTLFEQREARCLDGPGRVDLSEGPPHDGLVREGLWWFTTVSGHVIAVHPDTLERKVHLDLNALSDTPHMLGWCRGLDVRGSRLVVGMTMLRSTTHREVLRRVLKGARGVKLPTRVLEIDLDTQRIVREIEVGNRAGGTIYAVHMLESAG